MMWLLNLVTYFYGQQGEIYKEYIGKLISDGLTYVLMRQPTDQPRDIALCGATIMI